jgi:prepilin-type N-terminal cleavage/methylation domain-containing protein
MTERRKRGFSLIELLIVVAIILIVAAIAIPSLIHSKMAANESSAVGSLHAINTAIVNYAGEFGIGYPASLSNLGPSGSPTSTSADLIDAVLTTGRKSGYTFSYSPAPPGADGSITSYTITATPTTPGVTGTRGFYTDQSSVIRSDSTGTATSSSTPIG